MNKTAIEWCDMTWNPVTGCLHGCEYCYARNQTRRFASSGHSNVFHPPYEITDPQFIETKNGGCRKAPYPFGFDPTFHRYRLDEPQKIKNPKTIFVCSMADLFGDWVPDEWIKEVFEACEKSPQHRYIFLTKNPKQYDSFSETLIRNEFYYGATVTDNKSFDIAYDSIGCGVNVNAFLSIEPIQERIDVESDNIKGYAWVIIGAETGNRKNKVIPKREWIEKVVRYCRHGNVPVFMKNNLSAIWHDELIQEFPWS